MKGYLLLVKILKWQYFDLIVLQNINNLQIFRNIRVLWPVWALYKSEKRTASFNTEFKTCEKGVKPYVGYKAWVLEKVKYSERCATNILD